MIHNDYDAVVASRKNCIYHTLYSNIDYSMYVGR